MTDHDGGQYRTHQVHGTTGDGASRGTLIENDLDPDFDKDRSDETVRKRLEP
ncbi:MAG TPA: hypothetical protein VKN18_20160 [Blastocatellia bacterium]|nr:hypothetical protein [Blastocatellia bacterium]